MKLNGKKCFIYPKRKWCHCSVIAARCWFQSSTPMLPPQQMAAKQMSLSTHWLVKKIGKILVQTLKNLSILKKYSLLFPILKTSSVLQTPRYLYSWKNRDGVWLIPEPPKSHNHLFCFVCSRWGNCSHSVPQSDWPSPCAQPDVHHWDIQQLQYHQSNSRDDTTPNCTGHLRCTEWRETVRVQSPVVLLSWWPPSQTHNPSVSVVSNQIWINRYWLNKSFSWSLGRRNAENEINTN